MLSISHLQLKNCVSVICIYRTSLLLHICSCRILFLLSVQDISQQHLCDLTSVELEEKCCLFHIYS